MNPQQAAAVKLANKAEGQANVIMNKMVAAAKNTVMNHPVLRHLACSNGEGELSHAVRFGEDLASLEVGCRDFRIKMAKISVKKSAEYLEFLVKSKASDKDIQGAKSSLAIYTNDLQAIQNGGF
jgi:hypothetical protein